MEDAGFVLGSYLVSFAAIAVYALYVVRRGRRAAESLPDDVKSWT
jgi:hypothetical protein